MNPYDELPPSKRGKSSSHDEMNLATIEAKEEEPSEVKPASEVSQAEERSLPSVLQTIEKLLLRDSKFHKAAELFSRLISTSLDKENAQLFYDALCVLMCECAARDVTEKQFSGGYVTIFMALNARLETFSKTQQYRISSFGFYALERIRLLTDDSFQFARCCTLVRRAIEELSLDIDEDISLELVTERQSVLLCCLETAFRNYRWQWARQPCDLTFAAASERRLLFSENLRDQLDELTTSIVLAQRKSSSYTGPRTFRAYNSTAHPLTAKRKLGGAV